jgi:hypothetical protein
VFYLFSKLTLSFPHFAQRWLSIGFAGFVTTVNIRFGTALASCDIHIFVLFCQFIQIACSGGTATAAH